MAVKSFLALTSSSEGGIMRRLFQPRKLRRTALRQTGKHSDCVKEYHANIPIALKRHANIPTPSRPIVRIRRRGRSANWPVIPFLTALSSAFYGGSDLFHAILLLIFNLFFKKFKNLSKLLSSRLSLKGFT